MCHIPAVIVFAQAQRQGVGLPHSVDLASQEHGIPRKAGSTRHSEAAGATVCESFSKVAAPIFS